MRGIIDDRIIVNTAERVEKTFNYNLNKKK